MLNGASPEIEPGTEFAIAPMDLAPGDVESAHEIRIERWVEGNSWRAYDGVIPEAVIAAGPKALWQQQPDLRAALAGPGTIEGLLTGVRLKPGGGERRNDPAGQPRPARAPGRGRPRLGVGRDPGSAARR